MIVSLPSKLLALAGVGCEDSIQEAITTGNHHGQIDDNTDGLLGWAPV